MIYLNATETIALSGPEPGRDNGHAVGDNRRDWKYHADKIAAAWNKQVPSIVETGQALIEANEELKHGSYEAMVQSKLPFGPRTAQRLTKIAKHNIISNPTHVSHLPVSWGTLYELTKLPDDVLRAKLRDGSITPKLQRKDVAEWRPKRRVEVDGKPIARKPSLKEQLRAAKAEIVRLSEARPEGDDKSQFDLETTGAESIGNIIVQTWRKTPNKIERLIGALRAELKALEARTQEATAKADERALEKARAKQRRPAR